MARFGLVGGSYTSQAAPADSESTVNFYPEVMESGNARSAMTLYPTPGMAYFGASGGTGASPNTGIIAVNGRLFVVGNGALWELSSNGTLTNRGTVVTGAPGTCQMCVGNFYLFFTSSGHAYAFKLATNVITEVTASMAQPSPGLAFFVDGYYGAVFSGGNEFQISALEDPTTWSGVDVAQVSVFPENIVGCLTDHREIWFFGGQHAQVYYNSGAADFPLAVIPGAFAEQGLASASCPVRLDNSVFWLGSDERGAGIAWRANGYVPVRISNHAVEYAWSQYSAGVTDAIAFGYQDQGHTFYVISFPSGNATWVYDAANGLWHQRSYGSAGGQWLALMHAYCFGQHISTHYSTGALLAFSISNTTDAGVNITRTRTCPPVTTEMEWMFHRQLVIDLQANLAPPGDVNANVSLSWSDDGAQTWTAPVTAFAGASGNTVQRVVFRRLGRSRARIYKMQVTDSIPWRIIEGYLIAEPGFGPIERLGTYFGKMR